LPAPPRPDQTRRLGVVSALLKDNPLGDPHVRELPVYLPPQYGAADARRFPVAWYLAGFTGWGGMKLDRQRAWEPSLADRLDELFTDGGVAPMIVAFPDCFTRYGGAQYLDSPAFGPYARHLIEELVPLVDAELRTLADRDHRAVMGKSSGGYGALVLGMRHPDVFGLVSSTAGDSHFDLTMRLDLAKATQTFRKHGGPRAFIEAFFSKSKRSGADITAMMMIACAQAYTPDPDVPVVRARLPIDWQTGELDEALWQRWLDHDPVHLAPRHRDAIAGLRLLHLDAGTRDEWALDLGHRRFLAACRALGLEDADVSIVHDEFDGGHMGIDHRILTAVERIAAHLPLSHTTEAGDA
jgi:S-formylglutathione hydrolase FrmB